MSEGLVVSLTSYPKRYADLELTLRSLLGQTVRPDEVSLWVAHKDAGALPQSVLGLRRHGLSVRTTDDLRSYKKIVPALLSDTRAYIVTADDDLYYGPHWIEGLLDGLDNSKRELICKRAHRIAFAQDGSTLPYELWDMEATQLSASPHILPTNGAGTLFPPDAFYRDVTRRDLFNSLAPDADDIWFYFMARLNGWTFRTTHSHFPMLEWPRAVSHGLWFENVMGGKNDQAIHALEARYGRIADL